MKRLNRNTVVLLIALAALTLTGCAAMREMNALVANPDLHTPGLSAVDDGSYTGSFTSGVVSVDVRVEVRGHRFSDITILRHANGRGKKAEAITDTVLDRQSLEVDAVSGATVSSIVILKAIESAFEP